MRPRAPGPGSLRHRAPGPRSLRPIGLEAPLGSQGETPPGIPGTPLGPQGCKNRSFIKNAISYTTNTFGKLDILFNNAGGPVGAGLEEVTQKDIDYGVHLLLASVILGTRYAISPMRENGGGCIINNSSIAGIRYRQGDPLYSALKAGVTHFT